MLSEIFFETGLDYYMMNFFCGAVIITIHEFVKAIVSSRLGDPLPKRDGRITLDPRHHLDFVGMFSMTFFGFGFGKPLETASIYYPNRKLGTILTYTIPSLINLLLVFIILPIHIQFVSNIYLGMFLDTFCFLSLRHVFFNIIPIYPLDGAKVLSVLMNPNRTIEVFRNEKMYQTILIFLILFGFAGRIIDPVCNFIIRLYN